MDWLGRVLNPGVPSRVAIPCNLLAGAALILVTIHPAENLTLAVALLVPAAVALYGTALVRWLRRGDGDDAAGSRAARRSGNTR
jgi:hypothetical protein